MVNNTNSLVGKLRLLGLSDPEAKLYLELLHGPATHLKLARATGINRTKVYRLAEQLEKRSLVGVRNDDRGTFLIASDPSTLEVELVAKEEKVTAQRAAFSKLLPVLSDFKQGTARRFFIHSYDGVQGFKQMLWHELKTKDELLILGYATFEELVGQRSWIEKHRQLTITAGYSIREILNPQPSEPFGFGQTYKQRYKFKTISRDLLLLEHQVSIYNDTVAIYHWRDEQKVGMEIINKSYAKMMRQMFEQYWQIAGTVEK